ncbi:S1C family serine protease [Halorussus halophilus]|uniref:S1C family serine protease n=1 Tax=Halorussus halophilus TaxID=2650975 RepID=UPI001300F885|nr:trypsin-like peptidase domain-containing protein [Halorussus halophilus]
MSQRLLAGLFVLVVVAAGSVGGVATIGPDAMGAGAQDAETRTSDASGGAAAIDAPMAVESPTGSDSDSKPLQVQARCNYTRLFQTATNAVVTINVSNETGQVSGGSGWVYRVNEGTSTAYVVTNWHVVYNATEYDVQFNDDRWREAELIGTDDATDTAVLRVTDAPDSAEELPIAEDQTRRGQRIAVLGQPFGFEESISQGIVSGVERAVTFPYRDGFNRTLAPMLQTDSSTEPGNSGGPWVNCDGEVVGMTVGGAVFADVNFAIASRALREVVPTLIEDGNYRHSFLGVRVVGIGPEIAEENDLNVSRGVMVADVLPGGPADGQLRGAPAIDKETGNPFGGDVILAVDDTPVAEKEDLLTYLLLETEPGETVNFTVLRNDRNRTVEVTLGERPSFPAVPQMTVARPPTTTAQPPTATTQLPNETTGVTTGVRPGGKNGN